jgi:hypothetical protein
VAAHPCPRRPGGRGPVFSGRSAPGGPARLSLGPGGVPGFAHARESRVVRGQAAGPSPARPADPGRAHGLGKHPGPRFAAVSGRPPSGRRRGPARGRIHRNRPGRGQGMAGSEGAELENLEFRQPLPLPQGKPRLTRSPSPRAGTCAWKAGNCCTTGR